MRIRYIGSSDPTDNHVCEAFGVSFPKGEWVDLEEVHPKLQANPQFEVEPAAEGKSRRAKAAEGEQQ